MNLFRMTLATFTLAAAVYGAEPRRPVTPLPEKPVSRRVFVGSADIIPVRAKVGFTTILILPTAEEIIEATCGDKENWIVNGSQNMAHVKPVQAGSRSNLNLLTKAGNVYSFLLSEGTSTEPDLKLFVDAKEDLVAIKPARFVPAAEIETLRRDMEEGKHKAAESVKKAQQEKEREIQRFRSEYPLRLQFHYRFDHDRSPFHVKAIFTDGTFTYIKASPEETPVLYELKDKTFHILPFEYRDGTYIVPKVLISGRLTVGKRSLSFMQ